MCTLCDYFCTGSSRNNCVGLYCCGERVGFLKPSILLHLLSYTNVFVAEEVDNTIVRVKISDQLSSVEERTKSINGVFKDLQSKGVFPFLKGWRNEVRGGGNWRGGGGWGGEGEHTYIRMYLCVIQHFVTGICLCC